MRPAYPSRRRVSNAACAAAPPPMMTIDAGVSAASGNTGGDGVSRRARTTYLSPMHSTVQQSTGFSAGARMASPVRKLKQA